jgi:Tfp pilus assembly protein PilO
MTEQTQQPEVTQVPVIIQLTLNFEQVNAIVNAVGKLPTETGVWPLRQIIIDQTNQQLLALEAAKSEQPTV